MSLTSDKTTVVISLGSEGLLTKDPPHCANIATVGSFEYMPTLNVSVSSIPTTLTSDAVIYASTSS